MRLIVVHYHLRPGGIRRIIEQGTPAVCQALRPRPTQIVVLTGEAPESKWAAAFSAAFKGVSVHFIVEPAARYLSEQRRSSVTIRKQLCATLKELLPEKDAEETIVWAHNLGIGRNVLLADELARQATRGKIKLISHHHDLWFDNRWPRWTEMRSAGFTGLKSVAKALFPTQERVLHLAINGEDARQLQRQLPRQSGWLPNLSAPAPAPAQQKLRSARQWLHRHLGGKSPVWLLPCRLLRRKNVAEALLLARWLRPEAWLVTTGGVSSADEMPYAQRLVQAARQHHWRLRLGLLAEHPRQAPTVADLLHVSEAVILTSVQEGFGLPYLEAAGVHRPLLCRSLPNIAPDLHHFGLRFPNSYGELWIDPALFDWQAEHRRQKLLFGQWRQTLPATVRSLVETPHLLHNRIASPVPFSRLTLTAQLEVLARPLSESWQRCAPLNPFLNDWAKRAATGSLSPVTWPRRATGQLGPAAYGRKFARLAQQLPRTGKSTATPEDVQSAWMQAKLSADHLYPLLWHRDT